MFNLPGSATVIVLQVSASVLVACAPSPEDDAMRRPHSVQTTFHGSSMESSDAPGLALRAKESEAADRNRAAVGPIPEPVSAAENSASAPPADSAAEAQGRRTLSTAFVRVGPDGHLTIERLNGAVSVLRNVIMRPKDYCGVQVLGGLAGKRYCGGYAEVAAARPGGASVPEEPNLTASNPVKSPRSPTEQN